VVQVIEREFALKFREGAALTPPHPRRDDAA
jgi:hypothetical protein